MACAAAGAAALPSLASVAKDDRRNHAWRVPARLRREMYAAALAMAKHKVRGGDAKSVFKQRFPDAAFSGNIFLWDTCFIACYARYHLRDLPVANALDNFYRLQDSDGHICREYTAEGQPMWPKAHPVSVNPPLLAFAELELYAQVRDKARLAKVYPMLTRNFEYLVRTYRMDDGLFFNDAFGSGMDNIPRYPEGWQDDGKGIALENLHPELFVYDGLSAAWNRQGRAVDMSAQMALCAEHLARIAEIVGKPADALIHRRIGQQTKDAINRWCWDERDGFYYDLGYGEQIKRMHIGMFWTLMAGVAPPTRAKRLIAHMTDPKKFWRECPVASYPADQSGYRTDGGYWLGGVWAPTNYMLVRALQRYGETALASRLARQYYWCVAQVYLKTGTFWENYAPDGVRQGNQARSDFCGWTAIAPIALYHEFARGEL